MTEHRAQQIAERISDDVAGVEAREVVSASGLTHAVEIDDPDGGFYISDATEADVRTYLYRKPGLLLAQVLAIMAG